MNPRVQAFAAVVEWDVFVSSCITWTFSAPKLCCIITTPIAEDVQGLILHVHWVFQLEEQISAWVARPPNGSLYAQVGRSTPRWVARAPRPYSLVHSFAVSTALISFVFQCFAMFFQREGALNSACILNKIVSNLQCWKREMPNCLAKIW